MITSDKWQMMTTKLSELPMQSKMAELDYLLFSLYCAKDLQDYQRARQLQARIAAVADTVRWHAQLWAIKFQSEGL